MKIYLLYVVSVFARHCNAVTVDPDIKEIEEEITAELYGPLNRVLVCLNEDARNQLIHKYDLRPYLFFEFPNINIEYHDNVESCHEEIEKDEQPSKTIIAAVVPKPFKLSSNIPMYFYDTPYLMDEEADAFPNGLARLYSHWGWLKHLFFEYITMNGWKRVAIVSDYSHSSELFEIVLENYFKEKKFVYNVQRCNVTTQESCNFTSALKFLETHKAVIIIANVEGENAQKLVEAAHACSMQTARYLWLVRDWPFLDATSQNFEQIFSMSLSPKSEPKFGLNNKQDGPHLDSIWRGLFLISEAVSKIDKVERIDYYYKSLTQHMNTTQYYEYNGYIRKFTSGRPIIINRFVVAEKGVKGPIQGPKINIDDLQEHCMLRSDSYINPCDDNWIMLICVVWLMFILMMFLIVFFFNRCLVWT